MWFMQPATRWPPRSFGFTCKHSWCRCQQLMIVFISRPQVSCPLLSFLTLRLCMLKVWTMLGLSPRWREWTWRTQTRPFLTSLLRVTSPSPGRRKWLRWAFMESSTSGAPKAASPMTFAGSPYSSSQSHRRAACHRHPNTSKTNQPESVETFSSWEHSADLSDRRRRRRLEISLAETGNNKNRYDFGFFFFNLDWT